MGFLIWLSEAQMRRIEPYFPLSQMVPRIDDRRVISGNVFVIRYGLRWRDAPKELGPQRRSIIAPCAGASLVSLVKILLSWPLKAPNPNT